jgi:hypothetical protein
MLWQEIKVYKLFSHVTGGDSFSRTIIKCVIESRWCNVVKIYCRENACDFKECVCVADQGVIEN